LLLVTGALGYFAFRGDVGPGGRRPVSSLHLAYPAPLLMFRRTACSHVVQPWLFIPGQVGSARRRPSARKPLLSPPSISPIATVEMLALWHAFLALARGAGDRNSGDGWHVPDVADLLKG